MNNYCTLFDSYYLTRGLALCQSLEKVSNDFHIFIFAFDDKSYNYLIDENLKNATIISLADFENEKLLSVKKSRTVGEYCWTATGSTIKYCIENYNLESCTYLDADLYFFADPSVLLNEGNEGSTIITEHRYTKKYDQSKTSGKYCVQFMTFHNNDNSMEILNWWIDACIDWCFARSEDGKFGDQKYLDNWTKEFKCVHVLQNLGGGVAPWNVQQYRFYIDNNEVIGNQISTNQNFKLIFYHFHALKFLKDDFFELSVYSLSEEVINLIYKPYIKHINQINEKLESSFFFEQEALSNKKYTMNFIFKRIKEDWKSPFRALYKKLFSGNNIFHKSYFE
jgi:hypothetical protein